jgi:hypothetical protein
MSKPKRTGRDIADGILAGMRADGIEPTKPHLEIFELVAEMTPDELEEFHEWLTWQVLQESTAQERREILSKMDTCPCCERWLGHNRPPADNTLRQKSFDLER